MATLLFASELPGGPNRVTVLKPLLQQAIREGHRLVLAMRDLTSLRRQLCEFQALVMLAPSDARAEQRTSDPHSLVELLKPACSNSERLAKTLRNWRALYTEFSPDLIVCCDSPLALLAAHHTPFERMILSDGFRCPPAVTPLPAFSGKASSAELAAGEAALVASLNHTLAHDGFPPLGELADLFSAPTKQRLTTLPELYPYGTDLAPTSIAAPLQVDGCAPRWPRVKAMRVFASLELGPSLPLLLDMLGRLGSATLAAVLECPPQLMQFEGPTLRIEPDPVDLAAAARQCHAALLHGDPTEVSHFLLAGVPLFLIPLTPEQRRTAERVAELGAGRFADVESPMDLARGWVEFRKRYGEYRVGAGSIADGAGVGATSFLPPQA